jgi:tetratricopeptide (TPR) repeat protein
MLAAALALFLAADAQEAYRRGVEAFQRGDSASAILALTQAAGLAPDNAHIQKALGVAYASAGDFEHAAEPFARACALAPKLVDACYYHARNLYALNRFEPSLEALRKALPDDRAPWRIHLAIGQALEALGRAEAEREFHVAIEKRESPHPDFDPRLHYAVFLFRQGRTAEALIFAQQALRDHPDSGRVRFEVGRIEYQLGQLQAAVSDLGRAAALGYEAAHAMLAKARARLLAERER